VVEPVGVAAAFWDYQGSVDTSGTGAYVVKGKSSWKDRISFREKSVRRQGVVRGLGGSSWR